MADESVVIEIIDKVDNSIASKIKAIATEARAGQTSLNSLQDAINKLDGTKLQSIVNNSSLASSALSKLSTAQIKLAEANARVETATSKASVAQSKANAATAAAQAATDKAALSALKLADANQKIADRAQAVQAAENAATTATKALADATARGLKIEADYAAMLAKTAQAQQQATQAATQNANARNLPLPKAASLPTLNPKNVKDYGDELSKLLGQIDPVVGALERLDAQEKKLAQYKKVGAIDAETFTQYKAKLDLAREGLGQFEGATSKATMSAKQLRQSMLYLPAQFGDLARQIAAGGSPMLALFQQGSQLTNMFGSMGAAAKAVGGFIVGMINPITIAIAAFGAFAYAAYKVESSLRELNALSAQFAATGRSDIDNSFIVQLRKELMILPGVSKTAATEVIAAFATIRDIGATNLKAASATVADLAAALGTDAPKAAKLLADSLLDPIKGAQDLDKQLGFLTIANFKTIKSLSDVGKTAEAQKFLIDRLKESINGLAVNSLTPLQKATNNLGNAWDRLMGKLSDSSFLTAVTNLLAKLLDGITAVLNAISNWTAPAWFKDVENFYNKMNVFSSKSETGGATGSWTAPKGPQYQQTTKYKTDKAGITGSKKTDHTEEKRELTLKKINLQLDNQIELMGMLGKAAEKKEMFDRIEESLLTKKIKLNDAEKESIRSKIEAIVEGRDLQQETNRIYEESISPLRIYQASLQAVGNLLASGAINQADANKQTLLAFQAYEKINAPLNEYHKALDDEAALRKFHGTQLEQETAQQNIINDLLTKGIVLRKDELQTLFDRIKAGRELNAIHAAENQLIADSVGKRQAEITQLTAIKNLKADPKSGFTAGDAAKATADSLQSSGFDTSMLQVGADAQVAVYQSMYDKIKLLREANLINAQDAAMLEAQVKIKQLDTQTAFAQSYFTGLAQLSTSSNKKLATIGKAAAISNAIIDTYKAATGAYASLASIPFVGPALGAAAAAAAIGAGMANVQAIRSQGFKEGGYTGNLPTSAVAGAVHGQEYVFDAASTSRIGVDNLEAMRRNGKVANNNASAAPAVNQNNNNMKIINLLDPSIVGDYLATAEGEQLIVNTMRNNRDSLNAAGAS